MDIPKFISDLFIATIATATVLTPRAIDAYLVLRHQKQAEQAGD